MPLYEYECDACGYRFEQIQKFSDPPADVCPTCGERKVRKLMSSPAIKFKGSGFYINDYAPKGTAGPDTKESSAKGPASQDTASKEGASSDSGKTASSPGSADKAPAATTKSSNE